MGDKERIAAERWLMKELDDRGANEMGSDTTAILYQIAIELVMRKQAEQAAKLSRHERIPHSHP